MSDFQGQQRRRCSDSPFSTSGPQLRDSPRLSSMTHTYRKDLREAQDARLMSQSATSNIYRVPRPPQRSSSTWRGRPTTRSSAAYTEATRDQAGRPSPPRNATPPRPRPTRNKPGRIRFIARIMNRDPCNKPDPAEMKRSAISLLAGQRIASRPGRRRRAPGPPGGKAVG
jgi:hypothetical protein